MNLINSAYARTHYTHSSPVRAVAVMTVGVNYREYDHKIYVIIYMYDTIHVYSSTSDEKKSFSVWVWGCRKNRQCRLAELTTRPPRRTDVFSRRWIKKNTHTHSQRVPFAQREIAHAKNKLVISFSVKQLSFWATLDWPVAGAEQIPFTILLCICECMTWLVFLFVSVYLQMDEAAFRLNCCLKCFRNSYGRLWVRDDWTSW